MARAGRATSEPQAFDLNSVSDVDLAQRAITVAISEMTRLSDRGGEIVGVWEPRERRIVVRHDQLADRTTYPGTFLHELTHAMWGFGDLTFEFEESLTKQLGIVAGAGLQRGAT